VQKVLPKVILFHIAASQAALRPDHAALANHLKQASIDFEQVSHWDQSHLDTDLVIVCSAIPQALIPDHTKIVGQRTLNRRTRLDALKGFDNFVQPYGCPNSSKALSSLLADWDATCGVIKYDWSYRRVGVDLICATENELPTLPADFDCGADVVMKVHDGDPATIKVDAFAGTVLGAARLDTRKIGDPNWQLIGPRGLEPYELDESTKAMVATASAALLAFGVGYASFDVMLGPDGPRIIEVNSTGVGTLFWSEHPEPYSQLFASAIVDCLAQLDNVPTFGTLRKMAIRSNNEREAYAPEPLMSPINLYLILAVNWIKWSNKPKGLAKKNARTLAAPLLGHWPPMLANMCLHTKDTLQIPFRLSPKRYCAAIRQALSPDLCPANMGPSIMRRCLRPTKVVSRLPAHISAFYLKTRSEGAPFDLPASIPQASLFRCLMLHPACNMGLVTIVLPQTYWTISAQKNRYL
jgi:hypothetical protein